MAEVRTVLSVDGEGGGMTMVQEVGGQRRLRVTRMDHTVTFLAEPEAGKPIHGDNGWVATWEEALAMFEVWPWPILSPRYVDSEFMDRVWVAIPGVLERKRASMRSSTKEQWMTACGKASEFR